MKNVFCIDAEKLLEYFLRKRKRYLWRYDTKLPVQQKAYGNTSFNTLMQFAGAVGTSVCAALVASVQNQNSGVSYEMKTAAGSTHSFIFLLILAVICLVLQITGFKVYETKEKQD